MGKFIPSFTSKGFLEPGYACTPLQGILCIPNSAFLLLLFCSLVLVHFCSLDSLALSLLLYFSVSGRKPGQPSGARPSSYITKLSTHPDVSSHI
jgi:hypothetical protein